MAIVDKPCVDCGEIMSGVNHNTKRCYYCNLIEKDKLQMKNKIQSKICRQKQREAGIVRKYSYKGGNAYE